MKKLYKYVDILKNDEKTKKQCFLITLSVSLFILALVIANHSDGTQYVTDKEGNVTGIIRNDIEKDSEYNFKLKVVKGKNVDERSVKIDKHAATDNKKSEKQIEEENLRMEKEAEISGIITDIELSDKKKIRLPNRLSDGSRLYWSLKKEGINEVFYIPVVYIVLILLTLIQNAKKEDIEDVELRKSIINGLPRFTNQLLLMMNSGVIMSDAFSYICRSYDVFGTDNMDPFQKALAKLNNENKDNRLSTASLINEFAGRNNVKELVRISTILLENEKRGSDIVDSLSRESRYLWEDRKIIARENGKLIDTKMSYPMALLLLLLIMITMAPAIMNL